MASAALSDSAPDDNPLVRTFYEAYNSFGPEDSSWYAPVGDSETVLIDDLPARWQSNAS